MEHPRFASALSIHPESGSAEREVLEALEAGLDGRQPDLLAVFVTHHHGAAFEGLAARLRAATGAGLLVGCTGESVVGPDREIERQPALSLWAACAPEMRAKAFEVTARQDEAGTLSFTGLPDVESEDASLLLFADPFSFPMVEFLSGLNDRLPGVPAVGGMASGGEGPGQHLLFLGDRELDEGAAGVVFESGIAIDTVVSQGCRPVGRPWVITGCKQNLILKLGGRAAGEVLIETLKELSGGDQTLFQSQPFVGLAVDAARHEFQRSDFLVRGILGLQRQMGALAVADNTLRNGMTVQFLVRDAASAGEDLSQLLRQTVGEDAPADAAGALLFSCNGRGTRMFQVADHDISRIQRAFAAEVPAAGFFANGEIGPVGNRNFLHGFTASVAVFRGSDRS